MISLTLLVLSLLMFCLATFRVTSDKFDVVAAGLAFYVTSQLVGFF